MKKFSKAFYYSSLILVGFAVALLFFIQKTGKVEIPSDLTQASVKGEKIVKTISSNLTGQTVASAQPTALHKVVVPVLMYHHVGRVNDPAAADLTVSAADFESEVKFFKDLGYSSVSLNQVYEALRNGTSLPNKPIVFSFDDGYVDVFENAVPILKKYEFNGIIAIPTELIGKEGYASWDQIKKAKGMGMEFASHTENHIDLTSLKYSDAEIEKEITNSKRVLEYKTGDLVEFFVYPYGKFNQKIENLISQAGYKMAFTTAYGMALSDSQLLTEPRVRVHGQNGLEKLKLIFEKDR